jgi:adenosine deaminase
MLAPDIAARRRLIEAMPKAELHLHLDGSLRIDTALDIARTRGIDAPRDWTTMSAALVGAMPSHSQAELLRAFDLPITLMQDAEALERISADLVEGKATWRSGGARSSTRNAASRWPMGSPRCVVEPTRRPPGPG